MFHIEIAAEQIISILGFSITNTLLMVWISMAVLSAVAIASYRKLALVPGPVQNTLEYVVDSLLDTMADIFGSRGNAERYFPVIATIFLLVLVSNWLGIFPGVGSIGLYEMHEGEHGAEQVFVPIFRSAASDLNFTLALALVSVVATHVFGIMAIGFASHISKFISLKGPVDFFVGILELVSEVAKMISFSFRLFGNVFAGEVLLVIVGFLVPFLIPAPFLALEIFVGFIQALVFAMLTMVFIGMAVQQHH